MTAGDVPLAIIGGHNRLSFVKTLCASSLVFGVLQQVALQNADLRRAYPLNSAGETAILRFSRCDSGKRLRSSSPHSAAGISNGALQLFAQSGIPLNLSLHKVSRWMDCSRLLTSTNFRKLPDASGWNPTPSRPDEGSYRLLSEELYP